MAKAGRIHHAQTAITQGAFPADGIADFFSKRPILFFARYRSSLVAHGVGHIDRAGRRSSDDIARNLPLHIKHLFVDFAMQRQVAGQLKMNPCFIESRLERNENILTKEAN